MTAEEAMEVAVEIMRERWEAISDQKVTSEEYQRLSMAIGLMEEQLFRRSRERILSSGSR